LNAAVYRGMVQAILSTYQAGKNVAKAIQAGIDYLVEQGVSQEEAEAEAEKIRVALPKEAVPPPTGEKTGTATTSGESKERKFITSIKEARDISDEVKEALGGDRTRYEVLPNEISVKEANAILNALGETEAKALVLNGSAKIPGSFRTALAQVLMKAYNAKGEYNNAVAIAEGIAEMATDWGQAVQALSLFQYLTPEGQILAAQRAVDTQVKKKFEQHKPQMDKLKKKLKEADKEAIDETLDKVTGRIEETVKNKPVPKRPLSYGEKNKIFTDNAYKKAKAGLKNFAFSGIPPELVTIAGYHIEAGARSFADFSKEMIKDFGRKVKPHLKAAYKTASKQLGGTGYSTDTEIANYFADNVDKDIAQVIKDSGIDIQKVIRSHYTEADAARKTLTDKLVDKLGLDQSDAETIAKAVETEFNKIAKEKKEKAIASVYNRLKRKSPQVKSLQQKLIELSNLGAFDENQFKEAYAEAFGFPKLTPENAAEIKRLAEIAQKAKEGLPKFRATEDLLKYQATIKGADWYEVPMAIWMSSILSGPSTQIKNLTANFANMALLLGNIASQNPKNIQFIMKGLAVGMKKGILEGQDVFKTGYSPIRDKAQIPDILERTTFKGGKYNPYNYYKYVRRAMVAADVVSFEGLKEMRAYQMALMQAKETFPDANTQNKATEILNNTNDAIALAQQKATDEFNEIKANIEANSNLSEAEKASQIKQAEIDSKRRFYEFVEELRPDQLVSEAHDFAERGTFNNKPDGFLGMIAQTVNQMAYRAPLIRLIVPFTNVITNVANETINYSPLGFVRAAMGGSITGNRKEFSDQQKKDLQYKAAMATTLAVVVYALSSIKGEDDDDEPLIEITADGFNDYKKNKDLEQTGWAPYSIKIGNRWVSYKLTPLVGILGVIGALKDFEKYREGKVDDSALTKWSFAFQSALSTITNQTFLPSLDTFISALVDKKGDDRIKDMEQWAAKTAGAGVPILGTNFYQQFAMQANELLDIPEKEYRNSIFGKMLRTVPIARNMYENAVNGLGEEIPLPQANILVSKPRNDETQKLWDLIAKNKVSTGNPDRKGASWIDKNGVQKEMTDRQFYEFAKARGEYIRKVMENDFNTISKMSQSDFKDWMNKTRSDANNYAQAVLGSGIERKTTTQQAKAIMKPDEAEQKRSKELFKSAIETKDTKLASDALEKYIKAFPTPAQKLKAVDSILESELSEDITQKVGIKSEYVDDFFKLYYGAEVGMGRADSDRNYEITRMKKILENKAMTEDIVRKYEAEYEKAKATRDMLISLDIKNPESGRPMRVPTPSWMRYYEKNIAPQMPAKAAPVKKEETSFLKRLFNYGS
jgi:hypothetical protein